jgi:hypothetical protein
MVPSLKDRQPDGAARLSPSRTNKAGGGELAYVGPTLRCRVSCHQAKLDEGY